VYINNSHNPDHPVSIYTKSSKLIFENYYSGLTPIISYTELRNLSFTIPTPAKMLINNLPLLKTYFPFFGEYTTAILNKKYQF
jgi:hypothetical protein